MKGVLNLSYLSVAILLAAITTVAAQDTPPAPPPTPPQEQPAKQDAPKPQSPEEAAREQLEKNLRATLQGVDVRVTMEFRNARVEEVVDEFRRQVRTINFIADLKNVPEEFRIDEFIVRNEPWRSALNAFITKAELTSQEESATLISLSRPPRVTFNFQRADIKTVIELIGRLSAANIIMNSSPTGGVAGTVTMSVNNVPWFEVLEVVCKTFNYTTVREKSGIIRIVTQDELNRQMEHQRFRLNYISGPPVFVANMDEGKYHKGKIPSPPKSVEDIPKQFMLLRILESLLTRTVDGSKVLGTLQYDNDSNTIVVTDTRVALNEIERTIKALDVQPAQVNVALKYISTVNDDLLAFGMNYSFGGEDGITVTTQALPPLRVDATGVTAGTATESPFASGGLGKLTRLPFGLGREAITTNQFFFTRFDMLATFRAFKRDRYSKLIQQPEISLKDNTASTIFVGEEVPYAETKVESTANGGLAFTVGEGSRSPVKIGFQLMVIARVIRESNQVQLTIIPQNEFLSGTSTAVGLVPGFERFTLQGASSGGTSLSIDLPRISNTTLMTTLLIENGRTAILGGLKSERTSYEDKKVPFLGDLPLIDFLFKQRNDSIRKETLLIFVTPTIIQPSDVNSENLKADIDSIREREREALEDIRRKAAADELKRGDEQRMQGAGSDIEKLKKGGK
jgi:type II secretory pathway component GspD/PulD (secretin)